jgi:hypothetical protein
MRAKIHNSCNIKNSRMLSLLEGATSMIKVLDLYGGLGGNSEAFVLDPNYEVIRIENNPLLSEVPHTISADIFDLDPRDFKDVDLILASPPCTDFSLGYAGPRSVAYRNGIRGDDYKPDMSLVKEAIRWNNIIKPKFFLMENVNGSQRFFRKLRLYPIMIHGPFVFYGNFPRFDMPPGWTHNKEASKKTGQKGQDTWSSDPLRANKKGKLPLELSKQIKLTFQGQYTLGDWL